MSEALTILIFKLIAMKNKIRIFVLLFIIFTTVSSSQAQSLKALREKAKKEAAQRLKKNKGSNTEKSKESTAPTNNGSSTSTTTKTVVTEAKSLLEEVKETQADYAANGKFKIETDDKKGLVYGVEKTVEQNSFGYIRQDGASAYLTFTNDYTKPDANMQSFTGKDFIYAKLNTEKILTDLLPPDDIYGLEYYRVELKVKSGSTVGENELKLHSRQKYFFKIAYSKKDLLIPVVPEKGFFEAILNTYKEEGKFKNTETKLTAYKDVVARNFSRQISEALKKLPVGEHKVEISFQVTARTHSSFYKVHNIKGVFLVKIDKEAQKRYAEIYNLLTHLYDDYDRDFSRARQTASAEAEAEMLKTMTPREQERYLIAKKSSDGYMAAYEGKKAAVQFRFGPERKKDACIDISWPQGSCAKCEPGTASKTFWGSSHVAETIMIPIGGKVTINGKVLVAKVTGDKQVTIGWWY